MMGMVCDEGHLGGYIRDGDCRTFHPRLWLAILNAWRPRTFLDVGCAEGWAMQWWAGQGVAVLGVEGSPSAIAHHRMPKHVVRHDFVDGPWTPPQPGPIDLAWCCEVVEHIDECHLPNLLAAFATSRRVALTHALPGQAGHHHVNCQRPGYWIAQFAAIGLRYDSAATAWCRQRCGGTGYFAATGLVFAQQKSSAGQ